MGGHQEKLCIGCKHLTPLMHTEPCMSCTFDGKEFSKWQTSRGRKTGSKSKPGSKKTGPKTKPSGELMCFTVLSIKAKDLEAYGGTDKLKADVKLMVKEKLRL